MSTQVNPGSALTARTSRRRLLADRWAARVVGVGGFGIIASILGILVFILIEVAPLTRSARVAPRAEHALSGAPFEALLADEYASWAVGLGVDGVVRGFRTADGSLALEQDLLAGGLSGIHSPPGSDLLLGATPDGRIVAAPVRFEVRFEGSERRVEARVEPPLILSLDPEERPLGAFTARLDADGNALAAAQLLDGSLAVVRRSARRNLLTGEVSESLDRHVIPVPYPLSRLVMDAARRNLYGGTAKGELLWWQLGAEGATGGGITSAGPSAITALSLLLGDRALVVGQAGGDLSVWLQMRDEEGGGAFRLARARAFPGHQEAIHSISPSRRNKGFLVQDRGARAALYHSTSERTLWSGDSPVAAPSALALAPRADAALFAGKGRLAVLAIDNPHPEVSWKTLFGRVWYEGADGPELVWQSTGMSDEFEPKLSLTPLLVGTLKGTLYSLILAIPLGVLGAMYASQFMHPRLLGRIKPVVEIMAALPSVVLGFLAGLWLAPRLELYFPALLVMIVLLAPAILAAGGLWSVLPRSFRGRFPTGAEAIFFTVVLLGVLWLSIAVSRPVEAALFGGDFTTWLRETTGLAYDQRNAVVIGLAMGFAVIPIIFAISEDAFSNVPRNLVAGSLALGANRWQTVTRVVLPSASPGIFSAVMVGLGRAVGETMIVLMATGNTPIMDWSPFNGFRTLSANIAVEIPEAPVYGTLYRVLFLAALLLFAITFVINTVAEIIRQRLRRRYSQL